MEPKLGFKIDKLYMELQDDATLHNILNNGKEVWIMVTQLKKK